MADPIQVEAEDGSFRAIRPALAAFLARLGIATGALGIVTVENSRGENGRGRSYPS